MAKGKSFAEKAMKGTKPKDEGVTYKVIRPKITGKGAISFEAKIVRVRKGDDEAERLGI